MTHHKVKIDGEAVTCYHAGPYHLVIYKDHWKFLDECVLRHPSGNSPLGGRGRSVQG